MAAAKAIVSQPKRRASSNTLSSKGKVMNTIKKITAFSVMLSLTFSMLFQGTMALASPLLMGIESPFVLPEATAGKEYTHQFKAEGGSPPLTWHVTQGELPSGLKLETSGKLQGILTQARAESYRFVLEVRDSSPLPQRYSQAFLLVVQAAPLRIVLSQPATESGLRIVTAANRQPDLIVPVGSGMANSTSTSAIMGVNIPQPAKASVASDVPNAAPATPDTAPAATHEVSGRLRPASLDELFAQIISNPKLSSQPVIRTKLCHIGFKEFCENSATLNGNHKAETIELLTWLLESSESDQPELPELNLQKKTELAAQLKDQASGIPRKKLRKLIELLSSVRSNTITVRAEDKKGKLVATAVCGENGEYKFRLADNDLGNTEDGDDYYVLSTEADNYFTKKIIVVKGEDLKISLSIEDRPVSLLARAVVGYQQAGAASTAFEQNYFFDLFVSQSLPFRQKIDPDFGEPFRTWGAIRAISAPQSGNVTIGDLSSNFVTKISELKANEAARVFDYLAGIEYRLPFFKNRSLLPSFDRQTKQKFTLSFIASGGFVTPTNPSEAQPKTYKISDQFRARFKSEAVGSELLTGNELDGKEYVSFVPTDRDRFFRQYYAGFRMQTFFFNRHDVPLQRFPEQLDLQYGINEYVTGGRARGGVFRLDGYFPLPYDSLNFINLFGTAIFRPVRSKIQRTSILEEVEGKFFDGQTATLPFTQFNRDYYRVGVGIDFVSFVGKLLKNK
jgi:hypothetical protein